uniref:Uncharacterized protein n=1 Tax=Chaetoceros debilis TaxID=122233 RepID=A0A7S3QDM4_9STRA
MMPITQRVYNYLLPLDWLEGGEEMGEGLLDTWRDRDRQTQTQESQSQSQNSSFSFKDGSSYGGLAKAESPPPNGTLRTLKDCLRSAESKRLEKSDISGIRGGKNNNNDDNDDDSAGDDIGDKDNDNDKHRGSIENLASGRYGVLASKKRRAFHNFADSALKESPANKLSWRVLDRCRITEQLPFTDENGDTHIVLVIAFVGDDFLPQQVSKIIGSAVAMSNGWFPADFIGTATRAERIIETAPFAPANLMYFDEAKFHFDQLVRGKNLFDNAAVGMRKNYSFVADIHRNVLERWYSPQSQMEEASWQHDLQRNVAPRVIEQLNIQDRDGCFHHMNSSNDQMERDDFILGDVDVDVKYEKSLSILRDIISSGQ